MPLRSLGGVSDGRITDHWGVGNLYSLVRRLEGEAGPGVGRLTPRIEQRPDRVRDARLAARRGPPRSVAEGKIAPEVGGTFALQDAASARQLGARTAAGKLALIP